MIPFSKLTWQVAVAGRWTARVGGTLMVLFLLAFVFGEGPPPLGRLTAREQLYAVGMGGLFLGLILAWFWEGWGGLVSLLGWGLLAVLAGRLPWDWPLSIPAAMGLLHLLCWWRLRGPAPPAEPVDAAAAAHIRILFTCLWGLVAVFIVLCANEVFGQPPLMTGTGRPPAGLVGTWSADQPRLPTLPVVFTIGPDGSVSGTVSDAKVVDGRYTANRSWFGRMMHWRTAYLIRGRLSRAVGSYGGTAGDRFSAPLNPRGSELDGALFLSHPGAPKPLGLRLEKR